MYRLEYRCTKLNVSTVISSERNFLVGRQQQLNRQVTPDIPKKFVKYVLYNLTQGNMSYVLHQDQSQEGLIDTVKWPIRSLVEEFLQKHSISQSEENKS